jgi:hypothetical protein
VLARPVPPEPARFSGAQMVGDFVILGWDTAYGTVGWGYSLRFAQASARSLADAVYAQFWDHMADIYATLVVPLVRVNLDGSPELRAIDLYPATQLSDVYEPTWSRLAGILGTAPPWFHYALRDAQTISTWKPGNPPAIVPAEEAELPTRALLALAADEPDGSPAAAVCLWLARHLRRRAAEAAQRDIDEIRDTARTRGGGCALLQVAAVPAPVTRPEDPQPSEMVQRGGWAQIVERRDVLAEAVADVVLRWDGGRSWPAAETAQFDPASSPAAAEWVRRLRPAPADQPPTVLERRLLENVHSADQRELLYDDATGYAAVRRTDHMGEVTIHASIPQRISTLAPLSEVTLGGEVVWIRTSDDGLWLAPEIPGHGLSWGYSGGGPHALAALLNKRLDDITSPPVSGDEDPPNGLFSLIEATPQDGVTTYTRAQLLAARAG